MPLTYTPEQEQAEKDNGDLLACIANVDREIARRVLRKYNGDIDKAADALLAGERGEVWDTEHRRTPEPTYLDSRNNSTSSLPVLALLPSTSVIDLTADDDDINRAIQMSMQESSQMGEIVLPSGGHPAGELDRISPSISRGPRQLRSSRYPSHTSRNFPPRPAPPVPSTTLPIQDARPPSQPRPARVPVPGTVFVNWKGEEGRSRKAGVPSASSNWPTNRLAKNMTKSMDNLKLSGHSSSNRRNPPQQVPVRPPPTNPSRELPYSPSLTANSILTLSGIAKSYEPPRAGFTRPLPVQGSPHGPSSDFNQGSAGQYSLRGGSYSSSLMSPSQDPFPRPRSAAGNTMTSPTRGYSQLQSPIYGSTLDSGESNRSPRSISPNRAYHSSGIRGPRPRPANAWTS